MSDQIRVAVVGTGYFGRFHANHYSRNPRAKLVAVVDANEERARAVAAEFGAEPVFDYRSVIGRVDAASVAVPTTLHYEVARPLIEAGINVLIEKPITETVESATALTKLAEERNVVLQVGQIERFSSSYRALSTLIADPLYFESYRIAPWKERGIEVDVILDLMIHDIDMIMGLVPSRVATVDAVGTPVLGRSIDLANARITFEFGMRRQRHGKPRELQDRTAHAGLCPSPVLQLRSRRREDLRLSAARRSDDRRDCGDRHRDT